MQVISTTAKPNAFISRVPIAHGAVALVGERGQLDVLPIDVARVLPVSALEYLAAFINSHLARAVHAPPTAATAKATIENETHLSPLADLFVAPACATQSRCVHEDGAAAPTGKEQAAAGRALAQQQADELAAAARGGSDAAAWLQALKPVAGPCVAAGLSNPPGHLNVQIVPNWALRRAAMFGVIAVASTFYAYRDCPLRHQGR